MAFYNAAKPVRPADSVYLPMTLSPEMMRASWAIQQLEEGGLGNTVEVKPYVTYATAACLDELVET